VEGIWLDILQNGIMVIAGLVFSALSAIGTLYVGKLIAYLKDKQLLEVVARYVRWAEQAPAFQDFSGEEKFGIVFAKAMQWAEDNGFAVDEDELETMIENFVKEMKEAAKPLYTGE